MNFYEMLSKNYDEIFPLNMGLVNMTSEYTPENGRILDVGCATGCLVRAMESRGYDAMGLEYEQALLGYPEKTTVGDMHNLPFDDESFDTLVCTGNTLAHVSDSGDAMLVIGEFARVLKHGGVAILQILNYDLIMKNRPAELPAIKTDNLIFKRHYEYNKGSIEFKGTIIKGDEEYSSSVSLFPILPGEMENIVEKNGLSVKARYSGFDKSPYDMNTSFPYILMICRQ